MEKCCTLIAECGILSEEQSPPYSTFAENANVSVRSLVLPLPQKPMRTARRFWGTL